VTLVDIPGTYKDSPGGPFAGGAAVDRPDYRMLAAIVETPDRRGNHFLKFYGPAKTVAAHADGFRAMVEGMVAAGK
jgi:gluconolactonase